jgi:hypothetical protein
MSKEVYFWRPSQLGYLNLNYSSGFASEAPIILKLLPHFKEN